MADSEQKGSAGEGPQEGGVRGLSTKWKEWTLLAILLLLILFVASVFLAREGKKGPRGSVIREGSAAPDFALPTLDGRTVRLSDYKGKVVMVHFWATWCPPCVEEMPALEQLYQVFRGPEFEVLAVSVDEDGPGKVQAFMQKNGLSFPALLDPGRTAASRYGTFKFPETYLVDREGMVRFKAIGSWDWTEPVNRERVRQLLIKR